MLLVLLLIADSGRGSQVHTTCHITSSSIVVVRVDHLAATAFTIEKLLLMLLNGVMLIVMVL